MHLSSKYVSWVLCCNKSHFCLFFLFFITVPDNFPFKCIYAIYHRMAKRNETVNNFMKMEQLVPGDLLRLVSNLYNDPHHCV